MDSSRASNVWQGLVATKLLLAAGLQRVVRNRELTRFWLDPWLVLQSLENLALMPIIDLQVERSIRSY